MSKISYQDIETRLRGVEAKLDFTMRAFAVQQMEQSRVDPSKQVPIQRSLLELYEDIVRTGDGVAFKSEQQAVGAEVV